MEYPITLLTYLFRVFREPCHGPSCKQSMVVMVVVLVMVVVTVVVVGVVLLSLTLFRVRDLGLFEKNLGPKR